MTLSVTIILAVLVSSLVSSALTALAVISWMKRNVPLMMRQVTAQNSTAERGLMTRLSQTVGGERFYEKRY